MNNDNQLNKVQLNNATPETSLEPAQAQGEPSLNSTSKKNKIKNWWQLHKPSKRRLIQVYAALLYNCYIKGYISGKIFTGITKAVCVPGLNCYSCPGAVGACPLGSLQNALAGSKTRAPYYVLGILLLYGLIFGRTICGWLCPVGLGQDLLYKIKTPKVKKTRVSRIFSYLKYIILVILAIGIPLIYALDMTAVPGFCKYICPAGTFGGAIMLLIHPENASMYTMLGPLFTWKMIVLVGIIAGCVFIYRMFCRFLCPLGAIYGLFNKFALLGIKLDKSKCIDCGKCVTVCKMDIKRVGDHECINCGECVGVCPTKAISWKGGKISLADNDTMNNCQTTEEKPLSIVNSNLGNDGKMLATGQVKDKKTHKKERVFKTICVVLAVTLLVGLFTYVNFFGNKKHDSVTYQMEISHVNADKTDLLSFRLGDNTDYAKFDKGGDGSKENPFVINSIDGRYDIAINTPGEKVYLQFTTNKPKSLNLDCNESLHIEIYYMLAGKGYKIYDNLTFDSDVVSLDLEKPAGFGNTVGQCCYDFTLKGYNGLEEATLHDYKGKVVVINFWATWCGGCVKELPEFEDLLAIYPEIEIFAIHGAAVTENVQDYINDKGWSKWGVKFVQDTGSGTSSDFYDVLGGDGTYPRTFILDKEGVIRYIFEGSITQQMLADAVEDLSN